MTRIIEKNEKGEFELIDTCKNKVTVEDIDANIALEEDLEREHREKKEQWQALKAQMQVK